MPRVFWVFFSPENFNLEIQDLLDRLRRVSASKLNLSSSDSRPTERSSATREREKREDKIVGFCHGFLSVRWGLTFSLLLLAVIDLCVAPLSAVL